MGKVMALHGGLWLCWCSVVTSGLALAWRYPEAFGGWWVGPVKVFLPGQFLSWYRVTHPGDHWAIHAAGLLCLAFAGLCAWKVWATARAGEAERRGVGRFQETEDDLRGSGLL